MTPALHSISPASANDPPKHPASSPASERIQPPEKFRSAMERLLAFFSPAHPTAKAKSSDDDAPVTPARKKDKAGKPEVDATDNGHPPAPQSKFDLTPMPGALGPPAPHCAIPPVAAELLVVAARETTNFEPASVTARVTRTLAESDKTAVTSAVMEQENASPTAMVGQTAPPPPAQNSTSALAAHTHGAPAQNSVDLPKGLSSVAVGTQNTHSARPENQSPRAGAVLGAPLPLPEKSTRETPAAKTSAGAEGIQKLPAAIAITVSPRPAAPPPAEPPPAYAGTAIAQQDTTMKMAAKKTNFSGAKQKLPSSATGSRAAAPAAGENLPIRLPRDSAPAAIGNQVKLALPSGAGAPSVSSHSEMPQVVSANIVDLPRVATTSPPYVERARETISLQVVHLQEAGADEMRVVIKPDVGLQLSLHLQQRDGAVEVQAVLDRGNFALLNQHWPELQQQLELRGVRVAPLANADLSFGGGSAGFRQPTPSHGQPAGDDAEPAAKPVVLFPGLPPATATASASGISSRRWETWA